MKIKFWQALDSRIRRWVWRRVWLQPKNQDEARTLIRELHWRDLLSESLRNMLEGAFNISRLRASDIMIPRSEMKVIQIDASHEDVVESVIQHGHSRYPVIDDDRGVVEGILLAKDVLTRVGASEDRDFSIKDMMLPPHTLPESKRLSSLLRDFQHKHSHMGIVINEYGEAAGLVTIEDVLEEIVGEIEDEHDREMESPPIRVVGEGHHEVNATMPIADFNRHFKSSLDSAGQETIGGLVLKRIGHLPAIEERVEIERFVFTVVRVSDRRIRLLDVSQAPSGR